ncbi:hypothetical protein D7B24_002728 [Verticillium nonalfalfae]|uniref:Protein kinase domain-containing protein n=1 Tax=Verticillium nonalfalfae TaxID=1051616 RepID=A0A3M9YK03_9PEZI|nr:uncharacterized protein D7B24_002728 [Verticillium nonalfalfae]RNJ59350.1 hypothetical protein D7B24_002728 [Verticillium nonalfalfae]
MDSVFPAGGYQLPMHRRLSRLYNDTKKSSDFLTQPVQNAEDPDIKALHRKLRIQKDRFVSWGMEWSDPSQTEEIDESLSKAGLSEVVGSILSTIHDIVAEAEPLWQSSKALVSGGKASEKSSGDKKIPIVAWDKGRFEDLIRDLTTSVDTLYDLSRTRSSGAFSAPSSRTKLSKSTASAEDLRSFESTRMQTPQQIDPSSLTNLNSMPITQSAATRDIVLMSRQALATIGKQIGPQPSGPLLLEFAEFDPVYATTGIMPPMARFEKLSAGLQRESQRAPGAWTGLPRLLGYFEDLQYSRLGLVYQFPPTFNAIRQDSNTRNPVDNLCTLNDLLMRPDFEPRLEAKFRLANNLANTVFDLHARGITHGNILDRNVTFCNTHNPDRPDSTSEVDIRRPLISSFDLFPDAPSDHEEVPFIQLYRHPLDPRTAPAGPITDRTDSRILDLYSLAMILTSIGLWTRLEYLVPDPLSPSIPESILEQLAIRCGTLYVKAVQVCWDAVDQELAGKVVGEELLANVQVKASRYLEACCILDGVSGLDERLGRDLGDTTSSILTQASQAGPATQIQAAPDEMKVQIARVPVPAPAPAMDSEKALLAKRDAERKNPSPHALQSPHFEISTVEQSSVKPSKQRLYPNVPLSPDAIEKWHTTVMPQVNQALRHFYRKYPETVEISLESIGVSPQKTKPTVLVVCTSVSKVKAILKRKLGEVFEAGNEFGLKVCKGQIVLSRKQAGDSKRSMTVEGSDGGETTPANPSYQECPNNGASIGAWIGDRHLPPVSFGGLVIVDDKPYGMTVHHMLDDPDQDRAPQKDLAESTHRSMARPDDMSLQNFYADSADDSGSEDVACEFSDSDSEASETDITSDTSDDESESDDGDYGQPGDIPGVEPGCGEGYVVTQPAMDDVDNDFYPCAETADEDHLDSYSLGEVYASSGIRRREQDGLVHEIDWALFEFHEERLPDDNSIPHFKKTTKKDATAPTGDNFMRPMDVTPSSALPGLEVQCIARTSGLQSGRILPAMVSIRIYGRQSPSHSYQVTSGMASPSMGIPGDSGAWIMDREMGRVCGHVLAWSQRKMVAYICPMDVLLLDIAETLGAETVRLPGGEPIVRIMNAEERFAQYGDGDELGSSPFLDPRDDEDLGDLLGEDEGEAPILARSQAARKGNGDKGRVAHSEKGRASYDKAADASTGDVTKAMESVGIGGGRLGVGMCS